ncbi:MAG: prephenate dehydrogenase/arogenate dehydrogenase family protein [Dehalococcoidia bacterium]
MPETKIAIIGTGLIGASIGLSLTSREGRNYTVVGHDYNQAHSREAKKRGAIDKDEGALAKAVDGAGLVIIAVPVAAAKQILEDLSPVAQAGTIVTDTCSTKTDVMHWAEEFLPEGVHFVGGHPMAGSEQSGPGAARADLFQGATWAITPSPRAHEDAVSVVLGFIESQGAVPLYIDAAEHDQYAAAVSHLPLLISIGLFRMVRDSQAWEDMALLAGPGFRDLTRLASGDTTMARDILATNREAVLHWLTRFREELDTVATALRLGGEVLDDMLGNTQMDRDAFILNPPTRRIPEGPEAPSARDAMGHMFFGGMYDRLKEVTNRGVPGLGNDSDLRRKLGAPPGDRSG